MGMMTPIRVRGRKGARQQSPEPNSPRQRPTLLRSSRPSRPINLNAQNSRNTSSTPSHKCKRSSTTKVSSIERLPTEIIQNIFSTCLEINLPRASPILASALSSFYVKSQLFFTAFSGQYETDDKLVRILHSKSGIAKLQTSVLQLKWMTMDFLRQCMPIYLSKELPNHGIISELEGMDGISPCSLTNETALKFIKELYQEYEGEEQGDYFERRRHEEEKSLKKYYQKQSQWWFGTKKLFIGIGLPDGWVSLHGPHFLTKWLKGRAFWCIDDCRVPEKVLRGPWTNDTCELLETVTRAGATIDWIGSTSGEVAESGFQKALEERSIRAVRTFTGYLPQSYFLRTMGIQQPYDFFHSHYFSRVGLGYRPNMEHLRSAAINHDCPKQILACIMNAKICKPSPIDSADRPLLAWARKKKDEGDERGRWLLCQFGYGVCCEGK